LFDTVEILIMAFARSQRLIRLEVIVSLLIVIGIVLEGCEGFQCYVTTGRNDAKEATYCPGTNFCIKGFEGKDIARVCGEGILEKPQLYKQCIDKLFGGCHTLRQERENKNKLRQCMGDKSGRTIHQNTTGGSPNPTEPNMRTILDGRTSQNGRINKDDVTVCVCITDLCNPAGLSSPNAQVILAVLVAAALSTFNFGLGSFF